MTQRKNPAETKLGGAMESSWVADHFKSSVTGTGIAADNTMIEIGDLLEEAAQRYGLTLSRRCRRCRHPLPTRRSVLAGIGPRCAALEGGAL